MKTIRTPLAAVAVVAAAGLGVAGMAEAAEYARVISATPVLGQTSVPRHECADVQQVVQSPPSGAGALIGAIIGGVAGNQIGGGTGRIAATGLGAVAGAAIGNNVEGNRAYAVPARSCRTVTTSESRVIGYDVVYEYHGQRYTTRTASDPGPRLAIDVRPAAQPHDRGAQPYDRYEQPERYGRPVPPLSYRAVPPAGEATVVYDTPTYVESLPPRYVQTQPIAPIYYAPAPAYYYGAPYYYSAPYYYGPTFSIGIGGGRGWHHGRHHWHHHR